MWAPAGGTCWLAPPSPSDPVGSRADWWGSSKIFDAPGGILAVVVEPSPSAVDSIAAADIDEVWVAAGHPDPQLRGRFRLAAEARGLKVEASPCSCGRRLLQPYVHLARHRRAFVVLKAGTSLDGRLATRGGESQWITGAVARAAGRRLRGQMGAILVGVNTVVADDPLLTVRIRGWRDPVRLVLDSRLRIPRSCRLVQTAPTVPTAVLTTSSASVEAERALAASGVRVIRLAADGRGRVSVVAAASWLASEGIASVLIEGGAEVHGAFLDAGLVDRVVWFQAPMLLGGQARAAVEGEGPNRLLEAVRFEVVSGRRIGRDWMVDAVRHRAVED